MMIGGKKLIPHLLTKKNAIRLNGKHTPNNIIAIRLDKINATEAVAIITTWDILIE